MTPNQFCYHAYLAHRMLPHGERPTGLHLKVGRMMARWSSSSPSHGRLARAVGCCEKTVRNALGRFRKLGMLDWVHQRKRTPWGQWLRLANRYLFIASFRLDSTPARRSKGKKIRSPISPLGKLELQALRVKWGLA